MGSQTASQLAIIIFIWCLYKYEASEKRKHLALGLLAIFMLILSPSRTSIFLMFISIVIIYWLYLRSISKEKIKNFYMVYIVVFITLLLTYFLVELFIYKYVSLGYIYEEFILKNLTGFGYFSFKEILFGISLERENELFTVGEISLLNQLLRYGFVGIGVFYISIFYYMLQALRYRNIMALTPNIVILAIFMLGNVHYPVMFKIGVMELFVLHLAYIIYHGSYMKK